MSNKTQALSQPLGFERPWPTLYKFYFPSFLITVLLLVVAFLVLTPLCLMIFISFQTARPGQPIIWGMDGWVKAFTTPGIVKAMTNTFTLAITRQAIALFVGCFFSWLVARTHI